MEIFIVIDKTNHPIRQFKTYNEAENFKVINRRIDWNIKKINKSTSQRKTTEKQRQAVKFCEEWCNVEFIGNINNYYEVSNFLEDFLDEAKRAYEEIKCEYEAYINELYD